MESTASTQTTLPTQTDIIDPPIEDAVVPNEEEVKEHAQPINGDLIQVGEELQNIHDFFFFDTDTDSDDSSETDSSYVPSQSSTYEYTDYSCSQVTTSCLQN